MLDRRTVVFLSCSNKYLTRIARPIRDGLRADGYHAVIVEDEPRLPHTPWDPDGKVDSYLDASDAVVALCTPDNELSDGTVECRQNIIDEIRNARSRPRLRDVVYVMREQSVKLPSNINPATDALDVDDPDAALALIRRQLKTWGVHATPPAVVSTTAPPTDQVERLLDGIQLGDHDKAERRMLSVLGGLSKDEQRVLVDGIFEGLVAAGNDDGGELIHRLATLLEASARVDPALVPTTFVARLAHDSVVQRRICAASLLWDRADIAPGDVPLDVVALLARPATEDWYVFSPAMGAAKQVALSRRAAVSIFWGLAANDDPENRHAAVEGLRDVARVRPEVVPRDLAKQLAVDPDDAVAESARHLVEAITRVTDEDRYRAFGKFSL